MIKHISKLSKEDRRSMFVHKDTHQKIKDYAEMSNRTMQFMLQEMIDKGETQLHARDYL